MITPSTDIRLLKVPFELDNKNQLTFLSLNAQTNFFLGLQDYVEDENATYQRKDNIIRFPLNFDNLIKYNYCMYKNKNYSDKWFYAYITDMKYINDNMTEISIKTDVFQTWQFDIIYKNMFVEREHVNSDLIGEHTIPENIETGEYICNEHIKDETMTSYSNNLCFILASTSEPRSGDAKDTVAPSSIYNGIYTGLTYYRYDETSAIDVMLDIFAQSGKLDSINGVFMAPKWLAGLDPDSTYRAVQETLAPATFNVNIPKQTTLNGYTPKNNKLKCFPYNYLLLSNNIGQDSILHYEKFNNENAVFLIRGVLNPGCSINIIPLSYNGNQFSENDSIGLGKFPICNFQNDMYTNWLTQNSINILGQNITTDDLNIASSGIGAGVGTLTSAGAGNLAGVGMSIASGFQGIANSLIRQKQHNMIAPSVSGKLNSADVNVASGNNTFHFYKMSIKQEYAKIIDKFFDVYGYKVNDIKIPNITGRPNWNYVKTINAMLFGDIPQNDLQELKDIFDSGVTFWHNINTFGDYSQNNSL